MHRLRTCTEKKIWELPNWKRNVINSIFEQLLRTRILYDSRTKNSTKIEWNRIFLWVCGNLRHGQNAISLPRRDDNEEIVANKIGRKKIVFCMDGQCDVRTVSQVYSKFWLNHTVQAWKKEQRMDETNADWDIFVEAHFAVFLCLISIFGRSNFAFDVRDTHTRIIQRRWWVVLGTGSGCHRHHRSIYMYTYTRHPRHIYISFYFIFVQLWLCRWCTILE